MTGIKSEMLRHRAVIGANQSTTLFCGVHENAETRRAEKRSSKGPEGWILREGMFLFPPTKDVRLMWECCMLPHGSGASTWRFRTFYGFTKQLIVSVLLMLNLFQ